MTQRYERERECALQAVREAAILCRSVRSQLNLESLAKTDLSPVTIADFGSQALVCRRLAESFPNDPVIAEEDSAELRLPENAGLCKRTLEEVQALQPQADETSLCRWIDHGGKSDYTDRFWTLDPIDGTKGFLRADQYAVALALLINGRIDVAAMACPNLPVVPGSSSLIGTIFVAVRGQGAWALPMDGDDRPSQIRVTPQADPALARFCESVESGHSSHNDAARIAARLGMTREPVRLDSQAKYAVVGRGEAEIYLRLPTRADYREKIWDHASGVLIVEEAGGTVTDVAGRPLDFMRGRELTQNQGVIVTNGLLHDRVLAALG
jgi:3'(2'), 5'-bisphosphate nucleotidase